MLILVTDELAPLPLHVCYFTDCNVISTCVCMLIVRAQISKEMRNSGKLCIGYGKMFRSHGALAAIYIDCQSLYAALPVLVVTAVAAFDEDRPWVR